MTPIAVGHVDSCLAATSGLQSPDLDLTARDGCIRGATRMLEYADVQGLEQLQHQL